MRGIRVSAPLLLTMPVDPVLFSITHAAVAPARARRVQARLDYYFVVDYVISGRTRVPARSLVTQLSV